MKIRVGFGFDVHQLKENHPFFLGGVQLAHHKGAYGHSDADALLHAICDALLGAAALGDIGVHFPDTSADFKGIDSKILLERTVHLVHQRGWMVNNVDCTICLELPKIKPHVEAMRHAIAPLLGVEIDAVSIKATTNEKMGFIGREEGIAVHAVALLLKA
jgi:2-C-methyl-D-erythritol 2,4-cyclodiphosphate synthase